MSKKNHVLLLVALFYISVLLMGLSTEEPGKIDYLPQCGEYRSTKNIDKDWQFALLDDDKPGQWQTIDLPHSWNALDTMDGDKKYRMGKGIYKKEIQGRFDPEYRYYIRFKGANEKTLVKINGKQAGSHKGGYTAFAFEISDLLIDGKNLIEVTVDNTLDHEIMPLYCDFNFYGGIYRSVDIIVTRKDAIAVTDYASSGVYISQKHITKDKAELGLLARVSAKSADDLKVVFQISDNEGDLVKTVNATLRPAGEWLEAGADVTIADPHLWNGMADPYMYTVKTMLIKNRDTLDQVEEKIGLRYFHVDSEKGFFLNGEKLVLKGVNRHQDREGKANALSQDDHEEDFALIREMGANAVRLAHYPQAETAYSICDRTGLIVWAEIPFIGPVGKLSGTFLKSPEFSRVLRQQLVEMIRQNYNHPSILFWGLFNEIAPPGNPTDLVAELNALAKKEDPNRLTTAASFMEKPFNDVPDLICWNQYHGWYYGLPSGFGPWLDCQHRKHPERKLCMSEYGAGGSIKQHSHFDYPVMPFGRWHTENWQAHLHEKHLAMISERDFLWGSFLWNMFDFSVVRRNEGDRPNINDKGMITFDRGDKKDVFYLYKANWNDEPIIHITDKRFTKRLIPRTEVKVYCNSGTPKVVVNGKDISMKSEGYSIFTGHALLKPGGNKVSASAETGDGQIITDECEWRLGF